MMLVGERKIMTNKGRVVIDAILKNRIPAKLVSTVAEVAQGKQKYDPFEGRVKPLLYNMNEAARQLGCSRSRFWGLRKEGVVPTVEVGGTTFVRREDLERIVQESHMHGINEGGDNE
jgi:hypothetical protein